MGGASWALSKSEASERRAQREARAGAGVPAAMGAGTGQAGQFYGLVRGELTAVLELRDGLLRDTNLRGNVFLASTC